MEDKCGIHVTFYELGILNLDTSPISLSLGALEDVSYTLGACASHLCNMTSNAISLEMEDI